MWQDHVGVPSNELLPELGMIFARDLWHLCWILFHFGTPSSEVVQLLNTSSTRRPKRRAPVPELVRQGRILSDQES